MSAHLLRIAHQGERDRTTDLCRDDTLPKRTRIFGVAALFVCSTLLISRYLTISYGLNRVIISLDRGTIAIWIRERPYRDPAGVSCAEAKESLIWIPGYVSHFQGRRTIALQCFVPLWTILIPPALIAIVLWWDPASWQVGFCQGCGYDLRHNESGRCPECGLRCGTEPPITPRRFPVTWLICSYTHVFLAFVLSIARWPPSLMTIEQAIWPVVFLFLVGSSPAFGFVWSSCYLWALTYLRRLVWHQREVPVEIGHLTSPENKPPSGSDGSP